MSKPVSTLVLFDFDGTLTRGDSFLCFLFFAIPLPQLFTGSIILCFHFIRLYLGGNWTNEAAKTAVLARFFKRKTRQHLQTLGEAFCRQTLPSMLRTPVYDQLQIWQKQGATIAIVSASVDIWLQPFCDQEQITLICTGLQYDNELFTGQLATPNCNYSEKARRINATFDLTQFEKIIAYGNSQGDAAMFELADQCIMVND